MNFAFVSMEFQELGFPSKNENALVILNKDNQPSYVAHRGVFKQLGMWIPNFSSHINERIIESGLRVNTKFEPFAFAKIISGSQHSNLHLNYESWQEGTIWDEVMEVELYNPISVSPFENPQQKLGFADITVYADDLWKSGNGYASKMPVRNKSALVCINAESEIIFVAQAHKFREVSPEELVVHELPKDPKYKRPSIAKRIEFDDLTWSWEKDTDDV